MLIWAQIDCYAVQLFSASSVRIWTWLEYLYVVVLLGLLTQGPVLKLWETSGQVDSNIIDVTKFATYLIVQIPALMLLSHRGIPSSLLKGPVGVLLVFCSWMLLSTVWATFSSYTLIESVSLFVTCLAGLYIARSFTLFQQLSLFLVAMQPGLLVSWFAVRNNWSLSLVSDNGAWIGIYFNRNSLAPPAALGLLAALALLRIVVTRRLNWLFALLLFVVSVLDAALLFRSESSTSLGAIIVFGIVWIFWTTACSLERQKKLTPKQKLQTVYPSFLLGIILFTWIGVHYQNFLLRITGESLGFNGRELLWRYSWIGFKDRPLLGWGWMSAWHSPNFFVYVQHQGWIPSTESNWSHSAIMDVLVGGGIVGGSLLVLAIVWSGARQVGRVDTQMAGQWVFAATWFVIAASTQESFITGNHFMWLLLVALIAGYRDETNINFQTKTIVLATTES